MKLLLHLVENKPLITKNDQVVLLKKIKKYQNSHCKLELPFNAEYFCSYANNFSFSLMKYWIKKKNFFQLILDFFKEFYSCLVINDYILMGDKINLSKFKKVVLSWGSQKNLVNKTYYDKYLNTSSKDNKDVLWIIIYSGDHSKIKKFDNVIYIIEKKILFYKKIFNFFNCIKFSIVKKELNIKNLLHFFSWHNFFSYRVLSLIKPILSEKLNKVFMPYEGQPFQTRIIQFIKNNHPRIKCIGYIHSFPSFASHLIKKKFSPDKIIVNSENQFKVFNKYLGWDNNNIKLVPSARFKINYKQNMGNKIYLPINFSSSDNILFNFQKIIKYLNEYCLSDFEICNHPASQDSIKHIKLVSDMKIILNKASSNKKKIDNTSIFIGATGSVLEALFYNINVFHIIEDPTFELYNEFFWPSIDLTYIHKELVNYKVNKKNFIMFGKDQIFVKEDYLLS